MTVGMPTRPRRPLVKRSAHSRLRAAVSSKTVAGQ